MMKNVLTSIFPPLRFPVFPTEARLFHFVQCSAMGDKYFHLLYHHRYYVVAYLVSFSFSL